MSKASTVINIAMAEIGYKEKASNSSLDLATANAGSNNWTKYARDLYNAGYYNGNKNGYAWCDCFVDWCFFKAFGKTEGQLLEYQSGTLGAACPYSAGYYKAQGRYDKTPKLGDQVFFQQNGSLVHTGIVVGVTSTTITTVEGNASNQVSKKSYSRTNSYIGGYGHPAYTEESDDVAPTVATNYGTSITVSTKELKYGCSGNAVKALQILLIGLGYSCGAAGADGDFGSATTAAVRKYQAAKGLSVDGECGVKTWAALLS